MSSFPKIILGQWNCMGGPLLCQLFSAANFLCPAFFKSIFSTFGVFFI